MATAKKVLVKKAAAKKASAKKAPAKKVAKAISTKKEKLIPFWAMVTMKKSEAEIHMAFNAPISALNLIKWSTGYLATKLKAQAMIIDENIFYDWVKESVDFFATEDFDNIQDYPFLVQMDGQDEYYNLLLELNKSTR